MHLRTRDPREALDTLFARDRQHVFLEGGPTLARAFLAAGLVDEVVAYVAPMLLGAGSSAVADLGITTIADAVHLHVVDVHVLQGHDGEDTNVRLTMTPARRPPTGGTECSPGSSRSSAPSPRSSTRVTPSGSPSRPRRCSRAPGSATPSPSTGAASPCPTLGDGRWTADLMQETLDKTSLRGVAPGDRVNLERAVTVDKRLGGHIVQGHVDGVGEVLSRTPSEHWDVVEISLPGDLDRYLVDKGSITVDGVSLTVVEAREDSFTVSLIPETLARTTLGSRRVGDRVNLEADVIAKHVEKLLGAYTPTSASTHTPENDEEE